MPGHPGQGGDAGNVFSATPEQLNSHVELVAGQAGTKAPDIGPSKAGSPERSCHINVEYTVYAINFESHRSGEGQLVRRNTLQVLEKRDVKPGPGASAPGPNPATAAAKAGSIRTFEH